MKSYLRGKWAVELLSMYVLGTYYLFSIRRSLDVPVFSQMLSVNSNENVMHPAADDPNLLRPANATSFNFSAAFSSSVVFCYGCHHGLNVSGGVFFEVSVFSRNLASDLLI